MIFSVCRESVVLQEMWENQVPWYVNESITPINAPKTLKYYETLEIQIIYSNVDVDMRLVTCGAGLYQ